MVMMTISAFLRLGVEVNSGLSGGESVAELLHALYLRLHCVLSSGSVAMGVGG